MTMDLTYKNGFSTSEFRKPIFTGRGLGFFSFSPLLFKINYIKTLLFRAHKIKLVPILLPCTNNSPF